MLTSRTPTGTGCDQMPARMVLRLWARSSPPTGMPTSTTSALFSFRSAISWAFRMTVDSGIKKRTNRDGLVRGMENFFHHSLATSRGRLNGAVWGVLIDIGLPCLAPLGTVFHNPIRQRTLEADVVPGFLGFDPFVFQNLLAFGLKFPIKRRVFQQIAGRGRRFGIVRHTMKHSWKRTVN